MQHRDLRLITKLVNHYRDEASCLTTGEHRALSSSPPSRTVRDTDLLNLLADLAAYCQQHGHDIDGLLLSFPK